MRCGELFRFAAHGRCPWWHRPVDRREDIVASLDPLVGCQRTTARLRPHVIPLGVGRVCETSRNEADGHRSKPPARPAPRTPKKTADFVQKTEKSPEMG